jgi:hypothetical protein
MKLMVSSVPIQWNALMQHCSRPLLSGVEFTRTNQCTCKTTADQRKKNQTRFILTNDHYYASLAFSSASFLACRFSSSAAKAFWLNSKPATITPDQDFSNHSDCGD